MDHYSFVIAFRVNEVGRMGYRFLAPWEKSYFAFPVAPPTILSMSNILDFLPQAWTSILCSNIQEATFEKSYHWQHGGLSIFHCTQKSKKMRKAMKLYHIKFIEILGWYPFSIGLLISSFKPTRTK